MRTRPAGPLPTDPALADPPGKPREAQHRKPPRVGGRAGQPLLRPRVPAAPHPTKDKDRPSPASATPSSPGRHRPPVLSDLDLCPCWSLGRERGSGHPRSKHQTSPNPTSNPGQRLYGPQAQGDLQKRAVPQGQDTGAPQLLHSLEPRRLGSGWTQATGCRVPAGSKPRGCGRSGVARRGCGPGPLPPCLAGPALCRPLAPGPLDWPSHPPPICLVRFWARPPGRCSPFAQPTPLLPLVTFLSPSTTGRPLGVTSVGFVWLGAEGLIVSGGCRDQKTG